MIFLVSFAHFLELSGYLKNFPIGFSLSSLFGSKWLYYYVRDTKCIDLVTNKEEKCASVWYSICKIYQRDAQTFFFLIFVRDLKLLCTVIYNETEIKQIHPSFKNRSAQNEYTENYTADLVNMLLRGEPSACQRQSKILRRGEKKKKAHKQPLGDIHSSLLICSNVLMQTRIELILR